MAAPFKEPTRAMASAAAVRTDSSWSCNRGTNPRTAEAPTLFNAPRACAAAALTGGAGVLQQFHQGV